MGELAGAGALIRDATEADIPELLEMSERFQSVSGLAPFIPFDVQTAEATARLLMERRGLLILDIGRPVGFAAIGVMEHFWNKAVKVGIELGWWIEPEYRGQGREMLHAVEARMRTLGATVMNMACLEAQRPKATGRLYERAGYTLVDHLYYKVL